MATGWYVVEPPTSGLLDAVKGQPAKALMVGQNTYSGSLTASVKAVLVNFQGGQFVSGVATMLADPASASMNGIFFNSAVLGASAQKASAALSGSSQNRGALAVILPKVTSALNGVISQVGLLAATGPKATASMGAPNQFSPELVSDGGFEAGATAWRSQYPIADSIDQYVYYSGSKSLLQYVGADGWTDPKSFGIASAPAADYVASFRYLNDATNPNGKLGFQISYTPSGGGAVKYLSPNGFWTTTATDVIQCPYSAAWAYQELKFQLPELTGNTDITGLNVTVKGVTGAGAGAEYTAWIDEVSLKRLVGGPSGSMPTTMAKATAALAGSQTQSGILSGMLKPIGSAMAGYQNPQGIMTDLAKPANAAMNGQQTMVASFAAALKAAQAAFTSEQSQAGTSDMGMKAASFGGISARTVNVNSVSAFAGQNNGGTFTAAITVQPGEFRRAYAVFAVSHSNWIDSWTFTASTSIGPANFTVIGGPRGLGDVSGHKQGAVAIMELIDIPVGAQTISMRVDASQGINYVHGQVIVFNNVGGRTTPILVSNPPTSTAMSITLPAATPNAMHFICNLMNSAATTLTGAWPAAPGLWLASVQNVTGDGDVLHSAYVQGDGTDKTFSLNNAPRYATIGFNLINA